MSKNVYSITSGAVVVNTGRLVKTTNNTLIPSLVTKGNIDRIKSVHIARQPDSRFTVTLLLRFSGSNTWDWITEDYSNESRLADDICSLFHKFPNPSKATQDDWLSQTQKWLQNPKLGFSVYDPEA